MLSLVEKLKERKNKSVIMGRNWRGKQSESFSLFSNPCLLFDRGTSDFHWCKGLQEQSLGDSFHLTISTIRYLSHITSLFL